MPAAETVVGTKVYFIVAPEVGAAKVGYAKDVHRRLRMIQMYCPVAVDLHGSIDGASVVEAYLHQAFEDYRLRGEWFRAIPALLDVPASGLPPATSSNKVERLRRFALIEQARAAGCDSVEAIAERSGYATRVIEEDLRAMVMLGMLRPNGNNRMGGFVERVLSGEVWPPPEFEQLAS